MFGVVLCAVREFYRVSAAALTSVAIGVQMKALVLAGGAGTRLRPITYTSAKQLVPLANKPILFYGIETLVEAGVCEIGIVVGDTWREVEAAVGDGSRWGISVTFLRQEAPLGLAHCVLIAQDFLGSEPFVMYLGDNFLVGGVQDFVRSFQQDQPNAQILLSKVSNPCQFGVVELDSQGMVRRLVEKPTVPLSNLALVGVYFFDACVHEAVRAIEPSDRGELEITDAIQWLVDKGKSVRASTVTGPWIDTGKKDDLLEANRIVLDMIESRVDGFVDVSSKIVGRVVVESGAQVRDSVVRGPAIVGKGALVANSYIGPYSAVGPDCRVEDAELEHSILLKGSAVQGVRRIEDSLIGRGAMVGRSVDQPRAMRFLLGDHSEAHVCGS